MNNPHIIEGLQEANQLLKKVFILAFPEACTQAMSEEDKCFEQIGPNDIKGIAIKTENKLLIQLISPCESKIISAYIQV